MKTQTFILASMALFALAAPANAGPCTVEIDTVAKTLAARDAGSGPTAGLQSAPASGSQHPPTSIMKQQTDGKATSPEDVRRQTEGQPTAAQQGSAATKSATPMQASSALDRARTLDREGKESECMAAVREAKQHAGQR